MAKVILVRTDGTTEEREATGFEEFQTLVGGLIEPVPINDALEAFVDEEGKVHNKPVNVRATAYAHANGFRAGDVLNGDVVFMGVADEEGKTTDIPEKHRAALLKPVGEARPTRPHKAHTTVRDIVIGPKPDTTGGEGVEVINVELYYSKGGSNWFSGGTDPRGYYVGANVETRTERSTCFSVGDGRRVFLEPAARFSEKRLAAIKVPDETINTLVAKVMMLRAARLVRDAGRRCAA